MILRFEWFHSRLRVGLIARSRPAAAGQAGHRTAWWLAGGLTILLVSWVSFHWYLQPNWLDGLPPLFQEGMALVEGASAFTIAFLWIGLAWRWWRAGRLPAVRPLTAAQLYSLSPGAFEKYVAAVFQRKGYRVSHQGGSGDHGVDLALVSADGRQAVVQCKRYQNTVGEETVRELYGTLLHEKGAHAFLVTTAEISAAAREWAAGKPITLIDGETLAQIATSLVEADNRQHRL
jgi:restriction system protein